MSDVVNTLLQDVPERLERMEAAVAGKDGRGAAREAHAMKGGFLTVGAEALSSACQELIRLGELADFSTMEPVCKAVRNEWTELKDAAVRYLEWEQKNLNHGSYDTMDKSLHRDVFAS
jgi:HPt (histidine-containing phosphotransfer) domain-containing protein